MKYKIMISFQTGDSFNSEDREELLELEWNDLSIAKQNLQRIKEHYEYFTDSFVPRKDRLRPDWILSYDEMAEYSIELLSDDGKIWKIGVYWVGYFEQLYGAEIITDDSDMSFTIQ